MTNISFELLIHDFLRSVEHALETLEQKFGSRSLHKLWRQKKISQRGDVGGGISYQLHGKGCMIEYPDYCIDFDFGINERTDGFDAWRLCNYASEFPQKYNEFQYLPKIEKELEQLAIENKISRLNGNSTLYTSTRQHLKYR